jgi:hypothetical protein
MDEVRLRVKMLLSMPPAFCAPVHAIVRPVMFDYGRNFLIWTSFNIL